MPQKWKRRSIPVSSPFRSTQTITPENVGMLQNETPVSTRSAHAPHALEDIGAHRVGSSTKDIDVRKQLLVPLQHYKRIMPVYSFRVATVGEDDSSQTEGSLLSNDHPDLWKLGGPSDRQNDGDPPLPRAFGEVGGHFTVLPAQDCDEISICPNFRTACPSQWPCPMGSWRARGSSLVLVQICRLSYGYCSLFMQGHTSETKKKRPRPKAPRTTTQKLLWPSWVKVTSISFSPFFNKSKFSREKRKMVTSINKWAMESPP